MRAWFAVVIVLLLSVICISVMGFYVNPIVVSYSSGKIKSLTVEAVNMAIGEVLDPSAYRELTIIQRASNGQIQGVSTNMILMNKLSGEIALTSQKKIEKLSNEDFGVPLGTFCGLPILNGRGPMVHLRLVPLGAVFCTFNTQFLSGGVNQTVHKITLHVKTAVNLIMPLGSRNVDAEIDVLLCENVIVGEVPQFVLNTPAV
jgi:sporulation protein YunB